MVNDTAFYSMSEAVGLPPNEQARLRELLHVYDWHKAKNAEKDKYYEGHITVGDVNLGIALPLNFRRFEIGCDWGAKCVDVLASRSMFDGFVGMNGDDVDLMTSIVDKNDLIAEYSKACRDELKYGVTFATLSKDGDSCRIRFHTPNTSAALWDGGKGRIACGFAITDTEPDESDMSWTPKRVMYHTDTHIWILEREDNIWKATGYPHKMGRPLMEPLIWNATTSKPFGRSRLKKTVRKLIDSHVRTVVNATIGLEFSTAPQKFILGVTDEQYDSIISDKFKQYIGSVLAATTNPETGEKPTVGQFQQGTITPHIEMMRLLATQFSAATGLSVTDTGVVNDANPTSSDAIEAQTKTLITLAEQLNTANGNALRTIALMAQAIARNVTIEELDDSEKSVVAHFKNPAMPSIASTTDAALKIASCRQNFGQTDVFLEMVGFDQADIRRIKAQEARARGTAILTEEFADDNFS